MSNSAKPTLENVRPEDDLDDLDDVLDEFSSVQISGSSPQSPISNPPAPPPTATTTTSFGRPRNNTRVDVPPSSLPGSGPPLDATAEVDEDELSSDFAKELAKGMETLMREIAGESNQSATGDDTNEEERARVFKAAWEAMLVEGMDGRVPSVGDLVGDESSSSKGERTSGPAEGNDFQDKIRLTMGKLKESESNLKADSKGNAAPAADTIEALLQSLGDLGLGEDGETDSEMAGFLQNMMGQLMSKEILYEPLKELADSFPPYLASPPQPLSDSDKENYEKQLVCVKRIITVFDQPSYSDSSPEHNRTIVELMSEMQSYGSPPNELLGPLPAGFDGLSNIPGMSDENCVIA